MGQHSQSEMEGFESVRAFRIVFLVLALALALVLASVAAALAASDYPIVGSFTVVKNADVISDTDRSFIITPGTDGRSLGWTCMADGLNVSFVWGTHLSGHTQMGTITVAYQFPSAPVVTKPWDIAGNRTAAFLPMRDVWAFTQEALVADAITVGVMDSDGSTIADRFKLNGLAEALKALPCAPRSGNSLNG
jgi:hypothetical protein